MIEVGMIGNEGFVGVPVLLGAETSPLEAIVQIPGSALRMQASAFRDEASRVAPPFWPCCCGMFRHSTLKSRYRQDATGGTLCLSVLRVGC